MKYRLTAKLKASRERAFDFSADPRNGAAFHGRGMTITKVTEGELGVGTVFRYDWRGKDPWFVEITGYDRPTWFETVVRSSDDPPQVAAMHFTERNGTTFVTSEAEFSLWPWLPGWAHRLFTPVCFALVWPMLWLGTRIGERMATKALR